MRKIFLLLCLCLLPLNLSALVFKRDKLIILRSASDHKSKAIQELETANEICWYIPDPGKQKHFKNLITGAICSGACSDARARLISVGLSIIGSMVESMYDEYCELRTHLTNAAGHFEMYNFYSALSLQMPIITESNKEDLWRHYAGCHFMYAIDNLTMCDMITEGIKDLDQRILVSNYITRLRDYLIGQMNKPHGAIPEKLSETAFGYWENLGEVLADISNLDPVLSDDFNQFYRATIKQLKLSEKYWSEGIGR